MKLGSYRIVARAARGGSAEVFRARHAPSGRSCALKLPAPPFARVPELVEQFEHEARMMAAVEHPGVVALHERGRLRDGRPFLAMSWLGEVTLSNHLRRHGALAPLEVTRVFDDLLDAVAAVHQAGIVHCDLKASNVMMVPDRRCRRAMLVDFGIARPIGSTALDRDQCVNGTPGSMSPEQLRGRPLDAAADIYALGVLLFQLLTGRLPFVGGAIAVAMQHVRTAPPAPSSLVADAAPLDGVVARCLAKEPGERFGTAHELRAALRAAAPVALLRRSA